MPHDKRKKSLVMKKWNEKRTKIICLNSKILKVGINEKKIKSNKEMERKK